MSEIIDNQTTVVRTSRGLSIAGTRMTICHVMDYLKAGWPPKQIQNWLNLTDQQISDVIAYIDAHRDEVEAEYQEVLQKAEESRKYWEKQNSEKFAKLAAMPPKPGQEKIRAKLKLWKKKLSAK